MNGYSTADLYTSSVPDTTNMKPVNSDRMPALHRQPSRQFDVYGTMPQNQNGFYDAGRGIVNGMPPLGGNQNYELNGAQTWNPNNSAFGANGMGAFGPIGGSGATTRMRTMRGRAELPSAWMDNQSGGPSGFGNPDDGRLGTGMPNRNGSAASDPDDELIPTAIVIKNIPFAVRKEQLIGTMSEMNLPLPYAFNYHFDNGVFRGLAFANFTSPDETATVIRAMNLYELHGRKLRVEYKKMLPLEQRERIEREKRQRRGQLEEQHRPINNNQLHSYPSMSSIGSHPPPSASPNPQGQGVQSRSIPVNIDMNDPQNLKWYTELLEFRGSDREVHIFEPGLSPPQRRTLHTLAHNLGLHHMSTGEGDRRQVHVFRTTPAHMSPTNPSVTQNPSGDMSRNRGLNRAATTDFGDSRHNEAAYNNGTLRGQVSLNVLPPQDMPFGSTNNLRAAKSYADLRSFTPSPVYSTSSYSQGGPANAPRLGQLDHSNTSSRENPHLTASNQSLNQSFGAHRDDLSNGFTTLSLGSGLGNSGSPRRLRTMFSWDQESQQQQQQQATVTAPIGSNRAPQPMRQPAIPSGGTSGFRRNGHQSRGSDEYRSASGPEIIVE